MKLRLAASLLIAIMLAGIWWPNPNLPFGGAPQLWKNALHAPFFAILTVLLFVLTPGRWKTASKIGVAVIAALILSPVTEAIQPFFNRSASFGDLFANAIGIVIAGSGLYFYFARKTSLGLKALHAAVSLLLVSSFLLPTLRKSQAENWLDQQFPDLSRFDDSRASFFWISQGKAGLGFESDDLKISTQPKEWSGVSFFPGGQDWSGQSTLVLEFENPGNAFQLGIRIDDDHDCSKHDSRFNGTLDLPGGPSTHRLALEEVAAGPEQRQLTLSAITRLGVFVGPEDPARVFFLKDAFLE